MISWYNFKKNTKISCFLRLSMRIQSCLSIPSRSKPKTEKTNFRTHAIVIQIYHRYIVVGSKNGLVIYSEMFKTTHYMHFSCFVESNIRMKPGKLKKLEVLKDIPSRLPFLVDLFFSWGFLRLMVDVS